MIDPIMTCEEAKWLVTCTDQEALDFLFERCSKVSLFLNFLATITKYRFEKNTNSLNSFGFSNKRSKVFKVAAMEVGFVHSELSHKCIMQSLADLKVAAENWTPKQ